MGKSTVLVSVLFILSAFFIYPQEIHTDDNQLYVITDFVFEIQGRTREDALINNGEFKKGEEIYGIASLEEYIRNKTQILINQRVLKDNAEIDYSIGEQQENGAYPVILTVKVEDSLNIIAFPAPKYSSNYGFEFVLKARDYNFLGTMNPLKIDLGYAKDEKGRGSFLFEIDSSTPFRAFGYNWNFLFINHFRYRLDVDVPYFYRNITGLSMELPFRTTTFTFGFEESLIYGEENLNRHKENYGEFQQGFYMSSKPYISWEIPTGLQVSRYGELTYTPEILAIINHKFPNWPLQDIRQGPFPGFDHSLGFERIDWHGNYREGLSISVSNSNRYDIFRHNNDEDPFFIDYTINGTGHFIIKEFFAISTRIMFRQWFYHDPDYYDLASDAIRGIADKAICADYMLSLNMDFPFRIFVFTPSERYSNRKLRIFDFEFHISPVIDMALYHDPKTEVFFHPKNIVSSGGLEFMVFPRHIRSLFFRLCLAFNLNELITARPVKFPGGNNHEIIFTMEHHY